jgi:hypothetical protein
MSASLIGVFLCSPTNSSMFTNCCRVAITDREARCPVCRQEVYPGEDATEHERYRLRWEMAYGPTRRSTLTKLQAQP